MHLHRLATDAAAMAAFLTGEPGIRGTDPHPASSRPDLYLECPMEEEAAWPSLDPALPIGERTDSLLGRPRKKVDGATELGFDTVHYTSHVQLRDAMRVRGYLNARS